MLANFEHKKIKLLLGHWPSGGQVSPPLLSPSLSSDREAAGGESDGGERGVVRRERGGEREDGRRVEAEALKKQKV